MADNRRSIVLIAPNWLGDAVMCLPLVGYLAALPRLRLRVMSTPYTARVFWGLDEVRELIVTPKGKRVRGVSERSAIIRRLGVDGGLVLPPSFSAALTLFMSGVRHRVGFAHDGRSALLSAALPSDGLREEHLSENYLRLGREMSARLGLEEETVFSPPKLARSVSERETLRRTLEDCGAPTTDFAVVVPGATYGPTKHWPADKYRTLVKKICREVPVVLAGGGAEKRLCDKLAHGLAGVFNLAGATSLGEFFCLLERSRVVVANDSGAPHVAAALGVPTVVIFGSTSPRWTKPLGEVVDVVREPVHCSPCFLKECPTRLECYQGITPERVHDRVVRAMGRAVERMGSG
jgi:heptosyltransferase-2